MQPELGNEKEVTGSGGQPRPSPWPVTIIIVAFVLAGATVLSVKLGCGRTGDALENAFKTTVNINTLIQTTADRVKENAKLVVMTADVRVEIRKVSEKIQNILGIKVPLGTTVVSLRAPGNKVQFFVPVGQFSTNDFFFDPAQQRLVVMFPAPRVDEDVVEIQSDPRNIEIQTSVGWARLDNYSGEFLRTQARVELRPSVIEEAKKGDYLKRAEVSARETLLKLLAPIATDLKQGVQLDIVFR